ncbi:sugar ABC transporter permease [Pelagibacteraceae bacterium]|nr:sugar ABC transporter permease [Pelagibacteraceae bacterium]|tara:strand:- start:76 stop:972 length:897 start_codon:yes stop_codon:yes gene_type:complete
MNHFKKERNKFIILMLMPATILLVGLTLFPFIVSFILSFTDYSLLRPGQTKFIFLDNYIELMKTDEFWIALRVTVVFTVLAVFVQVVLGVVIATLLHNENTNISFLRTMYLLPLAITPIAATFTFRLMFNPSLGVLNYFMKLLGFEPQAWLASPSTALFSLILVDTWQWTPFILLICLGGLASLPNEPFEAAKVDGASSWQIFIKITVPMLYPFIGLALLFRSIDAFKTFDIIYVLTSGGPGILTRTLNLYAFKHGIEFLSMGYAGSIAIVMLIITIVVAQIFLRKNKLLTPKETLKQ